MRAVTLIRLPMNRVNSEVLKLKVRIHWFRQDYTLSFISLIARSGVVRSAHNIKYIHCCNDLPAWKWCSSSSIKPSSQRNVK